MRRTRTAFLNFTMKTEPPVTVTLDQLQLGVEFSALDKAFGPESLGILVVDGLPSEYHELRATVLTQLSVLATLPAGVLAKLENEEAMWLTGWSRGKEKLQDGRPDTYKGSFYVNCAFHTDPKLEGPPTEVAEKFTNHKTYTAPSIWPDPNLEGLQDFETNCKRLCNAIIDVAELVATSCDSYIRANGGYSMESDYLKKIVAGSTTTKARFLHYYPPAPEDTSNEIWCGEHLDHSCITGLTSAMFLTPKDGVEVPLDNSPDPSAGLYIRNRHGEVVKVNIPPACLAFQTGSALEEISRGKFKAVPHYVQAPKAPHVSRNTLAVFCQPNLDDMVNEKENFATYSTRILDTNHEQL